MKKHYIDNGNGTVTDTMTGLMWLQDDRNYGKKKQKWADGMKSCKKFEFAGHNDWRMPTVQELFSLVDFTKKEYPLINNIFHLQGYWYWTTTEYVSTTGNAMIVYFNLGIVTITNKTNAYYVRPVRGGPCNG